MNLHIGDSGPPVSFVFFFVYAFVAIWGGWGLEFYVLFRLWDRGVFFRYSLFILAIVIIGSGFGSLILWAVLCDRCNGKSKNCARNEGVEVFELTGHPKASRIYAWAHDTDNEIVKAAVEGATKP